MVKPEVAEEEAPSTEEEEVPTAEEEAPATEKMMAIDVAPDLYNMQQAEEQLHRGLLE